MKTQLSIHDTMAPAWPTLDPTPLTRHVWDWIAERAEDYQDDDILAIDAIAGLLQDLQYGGCASGMVNHLIYHTDTDAFFAKHGRECARIVTESARDSGCTIGDMFGERMGWDDSDPLALESTNKCLIVWAAFEETAYRIGLALDIEL